MAPNASQHILRTPALLTRREHGWSDTHWPRGPSLSLYTPPCTERVACLLLLSSSRRACAICLRIGLVARVLDGIKDVVLARGLLLAILGGALLVDARAEVGRVAPEAHVELLEELVE